MNNKICIYIPSILESRLTAYRKYLCILGLLHLTIQLQLAINTILAYYMLVNT